MDTATYQVSSNGRRRFILLRFIIFIKRYTLFCFPYKLLFHVRSFIYNSLGFTCYNNLENQRRNAFCQQERVTLFSLLGENYYIGGRFPSFLVAYREMNLPKRK